MARLLRLNLINIPQYIVQTGLLNQPCFYDAEDYAFYIKSLKAASEQYLCSVHAYVLLKNSVQIIATPKIPNGIPSMMQSLGRRYVQHINSRYKRTGSLWERYKCSLIDPSAYLLSCYRHVELQPLRYGLVLDIEAYPWSSFHHHTGRENNEMLSDHALYEDLGEDSDERAAAYRRLFRYSFDPGLLDYIDETVQVGQVLGGDRFKDQIEQLTNRRVRPLKRGRPKKDHVDSRDSLQCYSQ
ncbi:MAG: transposase [Spongiibacteraceae bacterium]